MNPQFRVVDAPWWVTLKALSAAVAVAGILLLWSPWSGGNGLPYVAEADANGDGKVTEVEVVRALTDYSNQAVRYGADLQKLKQKAHMPCHQRKILDRLECKVDRSDYRNSLRYVRLNHKLDKVLFVLDKLLDCACKTDVCAQAKRAVGHRVIEQVQRQRQVQRQTQRQTQRQEQVQKRPQPRVQQRHPKQDDDSTGFLNPKDSPEGPNVDQSPTAAPPGTAGGPPGTNQGTVGSQPPGQTGTETAPAPSNGGTPTGQGASGSSGGFTGSDG